MKPKTHGAELNTFLLRLPPQITAGFLFVWTFGIVAVFYNKGRTLEGPPWKEFLELLLYIPAILHAGLVWNLLIAVAVWFLFASAGGILIRHLALWGLTRVERLLISAGLGAGLISLALLSLGMVGLWHILGQAATRGVMAALWRRMECLLREWVARPPELTLGQFFDLLAMDYAPPRFGRASL